jgi:hypothetical protein
VNSTHYAIENRQTFREDFVAEWPPPMGGIFRTAHDGDTGEEEFAAELTSAIYPIVLANRPKDPWLTVELGLWKALLETVRRWARLQAAAASVDDLEAWQEGLLVDLAQSAYQVALRNGIKGSRLELKLCLYRAVRLVTKPHSTVAVFE